MAADLEIKGLLIITELFLYYWFIHNTIFYINVVVGRGFYLSSDLSMQKAWSKRHSKKNGGGVPLLVIRDFMHLLH